MAKDEDIVDRSRRLDEIIADLLEASASGTQRLRECIARNPEFATELADFVADHARLNAALKEVSRSSTLERTGAFGDEYRLMEEIGSGGMGIVYKALQTKLNRTVAIKTIRAGRFATPQELARFHQEAQVLAKLHHQHIVNVYEIRECEGQCFISMEYIEGRSLADIVRDGPLAPQEAASYLKRIAEAIQYVHDHDVFHRDLKPSNILIDSSDQPKVTDFGLARLVERDAQLTATGDILGTPSYMSPEQAGGGHFAATNQSDIYSLGAVLYELITGIPPFRGKTHAEILWHVANSDPIPARSINPKVPAELEAVCLRCLEKQRDKRYNSAGELADDLERFMNGEPVQARPMPYPEQVWRRYKYYLQILRIRSTVASIGLLAGPVVALSIALGPRFGFPLEMAPGRPELNTMAGVIALMVIWWLTEAIPAAATAFLPLIVFPLTGVMPAGQVSAYYADDIVFLFLGGIFIALALEESGLPRRFALNILLRFGRNPQKIVLAFMVATGAVSMWLSNAASTIIMLPVAFSVIAQVQPIHASEDMNNFRKALVLGIAYAATIGGMSTLVGTPANQAFARHFNASFGDSVHFTFLTWMIVGLPCAIVLSAAGWSLLVHRAFPLSRPYFFGGERLIIEELKKMGRMQTSERRMLELSLRLVLAQHRKMLPKSLQ